VGHEVPDGAIATVRPDGPDLTIVDIAGKGGVFHLARPIWSPSGNYIAYHRLDMGQISEPASMDICIASPDGQTRTNLTAGVDAFAYPVAWR